MIRTIIDVSRPIWPGMPVWPGDPPVEIAPQDPAGGLPAVSRLCLSTHAGTHVDPPAHFITGAATVDRLPLDVLIGPAWLADVSLAGTVSAAALEQAGIPARTERLLLRTANSACSLAGAAHRFDPDFVALALDAAAWLIGRGIRLVGIDGPSIEPFDAPDDAVHRGLLSAGVVIVEGLVLRDVPAGAYELICLPLPLAGGDGAPARVVLRG